MKLRIILTLKGHYLKMAFVGSLLVAK